MNEWTLQRVKIWTAPRPGGTLRQGPRTLDKGKTDFWFIKRDGIVMDRALTRKTARRRLKKLKQDELQEANPS